MMTTSVYFESYAPGMKAKLDPTYRREFEDRKLPARAEMLGKIVRNRNQPLMPFTVTRRDQGVSGRR
jgi:hypothetical protein